MKTIFIGFIFSLKTLGFNDSEKRRFELINYFLGNNLYK